MDISVFYLRGLERGKIQIVNNAIGKKLFKKKVTHCGVADPEVLFSVREDQDNFPNTNSTV